MTTYTVTLTPAAVNFNSEGSLDTAILNGSSIQRTAYINVFNGTNQKVVEVADGGTFTDTIETWLTAFPEIS
jgi:hypothetical protein